MVRAHDPTIPLASMRFDTGRKVNAAFAVALLITCAMGVGALRSALGLVESARWITHTDRVVEAVQTMLLGLRDAERGARGYAISGDKAHVVPYRRAELPTLEAFSALRTLTRDNPGQQERLDQLHGLLLHHWALLRQTIVLRKRTGFVAASQVIAGAHGRHIGDQIDHVTDEMLREEKRLHAIRTREVTERAHTTEVVIVIGALVAFGAVAAAGWAIRRDLAAQTRMEGELVVAKNAADAANRAKSGFLANMSHEIRTPMNGVIGLTDLVLAMDLPPQARSHLQMVKSSADALLDVINDILDFSKIEAGRMELDPIPFSLRDALGAALKALAVRADAKGVELVFHVDGDVPDALIGDIGRLRQIVINLVGNAIKFTAAGEIVVRVGLGTSSREQVELAFAVSDTGIGIPPDKREAIFHPFEQADGSTTRRYGGTGLGLSISTQLVALMAGRLWIEENVPHGTVFRFTARLAVDPAPVATYADPGLDAGALRGLRVLIVDDNATNRTALGEILRSWGMAPVAAASGTEALAHARGAQAAGAPFALVLLDARMPGMDGFAVAQRLGQTAPRNATIMMLTSDVGPDSAERCHTLGIAAYLVKPVTASDVLDAIMTALRHRTSPAAPAPHAVRTHRSLHVLLVEDNQVNQLLAVALLEGQGHTVVVAGTGREALAALDRSRFDAVLMDVQMPDMDGYEATAAIRKRERATGTHVPIVAMTAHAMPGDRERCLAAGMDAYVAKPIDRAALFATLEALVPADAPASARAPAPDGDVIDVPALLERVNGDGALLDHLLALFRETAPKSLQEIHAAVECGDRDGLVQAAHSLKGMAAMLGATDVPRHAERLERMGREGGLEAAEEVCAALERAVGRFEPALERVNEEVSGRQAAGTLSGASLAS